MSDETSKKPAAGNAPSHIVYFAPNREGVRWTRIGAQWPTRNGKGYRQSLDMLPLGEGAIYVLPNEPKAEQETQEGA